MREDMCAAKASKRNGRDEIHSHSTVARRTTAHMVPPHLLIFDLCGSYGL